jgi:hypothetical protein
MRVGRSHDENVLKIGVLSFERTALQKKVSNSAFISSKPLFCNVPFLSTTDGGYRGET